MSSPPRRDADQVTANGAPGRMIWPGKRARTTPDRKVAPLVPGKRSRTQMLPAPRKPKPGP